MKLHSIRFKITAITVAAILVAIFAIVSASTPSTQEEAERRSVETMRLIGENTKNTLNEYFSNVEQAVNLTANLAVDSLDSLVLVECGAAGSSAGPDKRTPEQTARLDAYISKHCESVLHTFESAASIPKSAKRCTAFSTPAWERRALSPSRLWTRVPWTRRISRTIPGTLRPSSAGAPPGWGRTRRIFWASCRRAPTLCRSTAPAP